MPDMKEQIVGWVRQIDELKGQIAEHWSMIQKCVADGHVDDAISLLNAYLRLKVKLDGIEASLAGTLGGYFSDR
ncbi:MAG TPA: hypothetical protein VK302_04575 [Terriglobales bacterium]|nr:hypothetical protein [Terriglobales bacterium]